MIPMRDKNTDISADIRKGKKLQEKIKRLSQSVAEKSVKQNLELDKLIAEVSKLEKFNRIQIQRMVEESNTLAYNLRYDQKRQSNDRRISFPLASLEGVVSEMGADAPPEVENPNLSTGGKGEGEMTKAASSQIESSYIHSPHANVDQLRQRQLEKIASFEKRENEKLLNHLTKECNSAIFKIANSLVMTERQYKNSNEVFNTMLSDVNMSDDSISGITKKASEISEQLVKTKRAQPHFMVTLTEEHSTKVADHLLGEYSLLKVAEDSPKVKEVKLQPTSEVATYNQLIDLARKLEHQQEMLNQTSTNSEVK